MRVLSNLLFAHWALLLLAVVGAASSARPTSRRSGPAAQTESRLTSSTTATIQSTTRPRTACPLYIWNAPSALLHKWCQHLMKDHIYEGRGGVKFVRIEPGSILQLLYPCSRYSRDSCIFCGGTFADHMTLAWAKHLYTPYDRYLDLTREKGVVTPPPDKIPRRSKRRRRGAAAAAAAAPVPSSPPQHVFHRMYVRDKALDNEKGRRRNNNNNNNNNNKRNRVFYRQCEHVTYQIPFQEITLLRAIVLASVEALIRLEKLDDKAAKQRMIKDEGPCC